MEDKPTHKAEGTPQHLVPIRDRALAIMELCEGIHALIEKGENEPAISALNDRVQEIAYEIINELRGPAQ